MASEVKTNKISPATGTDVTLGDTSDTFTVPSGSAITVASGGDINVASGGEIDIASGATLDVNGTIDLTGATKTGFPAGGLSDFSQWRLTTSFISYQNPITTNLELVDTYGGGGYGSVMTESSGEFTFPSTGWWYIGFGCDWITTGSETGCTGYITTTPDDSTWSYAAWKDQEVHYGEGSSYSDFIFQVASTTLSKVRFGIWIAGAVSVREAVTTIGSTSENRTSMTFIKLGDL